MSRSSQGALWALLLLQACAVEAAPDEVSLTDTPGDPAAQGPEPVVLAELELAGDHVVRFIEYMPGAVTIAETGTDPARAVSLQDVDSLADLYLGLGVETDPAILETLEQAQERVDALNEQATRLAEAGLGPEPIAPDTVEGDPDDAIGISQNALTSEVGYHPPISAADFDRVYCNAADIGYPGEHCRLSASASNTGWASATNWIRSIVINAAHGSVTHNAHHYVCLSTVPIFGWCLSQDWRHDASHSVLSFGGEIPVQQYGIYTDTYRFTKFDASGGLHHMGAIWR